MPLEDRPEFQAWLKRFEAQHAELYGTDDQPPDGHCDGCGASIAEPVSTTGHCLVCLAEHYGRDQSLAAARVAAALHVALAREEDAPLEDVREAVDEVLRAYEAGTESPEEL
jgi:hypothetical protein